MFNQSIKQEKRVINWDGVVWLAVWQKQRNIATQTAENRLIDRQAIFLPIGLWKGLTKYIWARYGWCSSYSTVAGGAGSLQLLFVLSTKENKFAQTFQEGKNLRTFTKGGNNKFSTIINQGEIKLELIYDMNKSWGSHISRRLLNKRPCLS